MASAGAKTSYNLMVPKEYHNTLLSICEDIRDRDEGSSDHKWLSMVVKLRVKVPVTMLTPLEKRSDHSDQQQPDRTTAIDAIDEETDKEKEQLVPDVHTPQENDPPPSKVSTPTSASPSSSLTYQTYGAKSIPIPRCDQYLDLEEEQPVLKAKQRIVSDSLQDLQAQHKALTARLKEVQTSATALIHKTERVEAEKKRLWDAMSKEETRELGEREKERAMKRQKVD